MIDNSKTKLRMADSGAPSSAISNTPPSPAPSRTNKDATTAPKGTQKVAFVITRTRA
ncbi:hypothetical protein FRC08_000567 [Ceratobasidium sp. 394]|nr:hypothetical protein FRC08_000567 [Ceratobasidium sp. 394]